MTQAFHLQNGTDGSYQLPTHPWGHKPPAAPQTQSKAELKSWDLLFQAMGLLFLLLINLHL